MDATFDWCVDFLTILANLVGMTYKEINVWIFVIIWPIATVLLLFVLIGQRLAIRTLRTTAQDDR